MDEQNSGVTEGADNAADVQLQAENDREEIQEKINYDGLKFSVKIGGDDMVNFVLRHSYSGISGWGGVVLSIAAIIYLIVSFSSLDMVGRAALALIGILFTVVNPLMLIYKARRQVKSNRMFDIPIEYTLSDDVLVIEQGEEQLTVPWENIRLVKDTKRSLIVYVTKIRAFIWPKSQIAGQYDEITKTLLDKMGSARVRLK